MKRRLQDKLKQVRNWRWLGLLVACAVGVAGASAQGVTTPRASTETLGLSKQADIPRWVADGGSQAIELTYQLTVTNSGLGPLTNVQVFDNLEKAFSTAGIQMRSVIVSADTGLVINTSYTGRGVDTTLISGGRLAAGARSRVSLLVRLDVSQASTLTFLNRAIAEASDGNGLRLRDRSTQGAEADPDKNGTPADNSEPTQVTLLSLQPEPIFIPEGFSPNNDGINDRFVIRNVLPEATVYLEIFNRWGESVYQNADYKNDWDGTANRGATVGGAGQGLPDGTYYYQVRLSYGYTFTRFLTLVR